jgi:EAL domain-containing protein (putative c-di-GMP-specific phosphodiesterase class I)
MPIENRRLQHLLGHVSTQDGHTHGTFGDFRMSSHFQPLYSLSHARVVGHEALLRARTRSDQPVPPPEVFNACRTPKELADCDSLSRLVHLSNFAASAPTSQWLFLNIHPDVFQMLMQRRDGGGSYISDVLQHFGLSGETLVLEVLESAVPDLQALEVAMHLVREQGCLIAIDDFGAGHSNFDRVWRLQPDIVKLDRSLVARAAHDRRAQRVVSQMVSLLHECGAMVVMEGIETVDEALLAMESDADMVQGYYFGRPQPQLVPDGHSPESIKQLYAGLGQRRERQHGEHRNRLAPYRHAIGNAGVLMSAGHSMQGACQAFLELPQAEMCYVLDANGYQVGSDIWHPHAGKHSAQVYAPLNSGDGACWARRPYFRRAIEAIGKVQITRPYRTLHGKHTCVTASFAFHHHHEGQTSLRVLCGDLVWTEAHTDEVAL